MITDGRGKTGLLADDHNRGADYRITGLRGAITRGYATVEATSAGPQICKSEPGSSYRLSGKDEPRRHGEVSILFSWHEGRGNQNMLLGMLMIIQPPCSSTAAAVCWREKYAFYI
jgi:hypothetical protein